MKVKYIIDPYGSDNFEKSINDFIKNKKVIDIKFQEVEVMIPGYCEGSTSALIMYEDLEEK